MYSSVDAFLTRFESVHGRTARLLPLIPKDKLEWRPTETAFSFGDLVRHLAGAERYMFVELATAAQNRYPGHAEALASGKKEILSYYETLHEESLERLKSLPESALAQRCQTPAGASITTWKWLRAMLEHEAHHRGQLYMMLAMVGVKTPPIFGLSSEQVQEHAQAD